MHGRRLWAMGLVSLVLAVAAAACGGDGGTPTSASSSPAQTATQVPSPTPQALPTATLATIEEEPADVTSPARYAWEVSTVDDTGVKPSIALAPDGTPHLA